MYINTTQYRRDIFASQDTTILMYFDTLYMNNIYLYTFTPKTPQAKIDITQVHKTYWQYGWFELCGVFLSFLILRNDLFFSIENVFKLTFVYSKQD